MIKISKVKDVKPKATLVEEIKPKLALVHTETQIYYSHGNATPIGLLLTLTNPFRL